jgi:site-specific recombinase XerD
MDITNQNLTFWRGRFLEYLEIERGRSVKTTASYDRALRTFFTQSEVSGPPDITEEAVRRYRLWLNRQPIHRQNKTKTKSSKKKLPVQKTEGETLKKVTQNAYLIALRMFLRYLAKSGVRSLPPEKIELARTGGREMDLITKEELIRLLESPSPVIKKEVALRDRAILELLFSTGLRVSELCGLNRDSVDLTKEEFAVRGKGEKVRLVFLSPAAKQALKSYLQSRTDTQEALFVNVPMAKKVKDRTRLTPRSVERLVKHYAILAGISRKVTPHTIRHSFATDLLQNGADIRAVQTILGHANVATTQVYTHVTDKHLREIHHKFHHR